MSDVDLWSTREAALKELSGAMAQEAALISDTFALIDEIVQLFDSQRDENAFARVCSLSLAKARNLAVGCYSLVLDGLAQEAGALMRPLLEAHELLVYVRLDASRVQEVLERRLPLAGVIAKRIEGKFRDFREHLNTHASHFSFTDYSLRHIFDRTESRIKVVQPMVPAVIRRNVRDLWLNMMLLLVDAFECLAADEAFESRLQGIAERAEEIRQRGLSVFELEKE